MVSHIISINKGITHMNLLSKLNYWLYHLTHLRTTEFMEFSYFLNRADDVEVYYIGGPLKTLQITGEINDYHWHKFISQKGNRFFKAMKIVFNSGETSLTDRRICIQIPSDIFTRKEIDFFKRYVYTLGDDKTNIIRADAFSTNVAEAVSKHLYRIEGRVCVYTFK